MEIDNLKSHLDIKDVDCEAKVIAAMISNIHSHEEARDIVTEDCFTVKDYRDIFNALKSLDNRGDKIDAETINRELMKTGHDNMLVQIMELLYEHPTAVSIIEDARYIRELDLRRKHWLNAYRTMELATDLQEDIYETISKTGDDANNLLKYFSGQKIMTLSDADAILLKRIEANMDTIGEVTGTPTGFRKLDKVGGLQDGSLVIIAAETSQGKTSFALALAKNAIETGRGIAFYSMEMTMEEISARILAMDTGLSSSHLLYGTLGDSELNQVISHCQLGFKERLFLDDNSTSSLDKIIASIRSLKNKHAINGAFIDYLQMLNVNTKTMNKEQAMAEAARRLKNLAKELGIWIVALSQLNRNQDNPMPTLSRIRDSGQIAEAADMVICIYRPQYYGRSYPEPFETTETKGTAMIDVVKGRNTGVMKFIVQFDAPTTHFKDFDDSNQIPLKEDDAPF